MERLLKATVLLIALALWVFPASAPAQDCGAYVTANGSVFTVEPNGVDDTDNLQCAFDAAVAAGPGSVVELVEGTYYIQQIVVNDFVGTFRGAGMDSSVLTNLPTIYVASDPFETPGPPSAENPWPSLVALVGGDFLVSDLGMRVTGPQPTTGWNFFGFGPIYELALGFVILGESANASFYRVLVEGEEAENTLFGVNVINGIFYEGFLPPDFLPISGSFAVHDSVSRTVGFGTPVSNLSDASVVVSRNLYMGGTGFAMDAGDLTDTTLEFSHNTVVGSLGFDVYDAGFLQAYGTTSSKLVFKNNLFRGSEYGVLVESTFSGDSECLLLGNNTHKVSELGVFLGEGTSHCTVVGGKAKTTVLDLGTDNTLVGVNNMGGVVGPTVSRFMRLRKGQ